MTTSFQNLTNKKLQIKLHDPQSGFEINIKPKETQDIDTSNFLEGTLQFSIYTIIKPKEVWSGYVPIKTNYIIQISLSKAHLFQGDQSIKLIMNLNDKKVLIPNILTKNDKWDDFSEKDNYSFLQKWKWLILSIIFILIIVIIIYRKWKI